MKPLYYAAYGAKFIVLRLPTWFSYRIASLVGDIIFLTWPRVRRNLKKATANLLNLPTTDYQVRKNARQSMRNFSKYAVDVFRYTSLTEEFFENNLKITGMEYIDQALTEGKGVILVGFHLGNLDMGVKILGTLGYKVSAIVDNWKTRQLDNFLQESRKIGGVTLIDVKAASIRLLDILRNNEILALLLDNPNCLKGVKVKLGQKWVIMPSGAATLAIRTGAKVIPCAVVRTSDTTFHAIAEKPIEYQASDSISDDVRYITQKMVTSLEEIARKYIDQWFVFHPLIQDER